MSFTRGAMVLCGGRSARMGRDKALLPFSASATMLERVVGVVAGVVGAESTVCVAAADQALPVLPADVEIVRDTEAYCGPLAGLATGLRAAGKRFDAVFLVGCDTPHLAPGLVTAMFEALGDHAIAAPHDGRRFYPLSAVFRPGVLPTAEALLAADERRLVALLEHCDTARVSLDVLRTVDPELRSLEKCNTPEEYEKARRNSEPLR